MALRLNGEARILKYGHPSTERAKSAVVRRFIINRTLDKQVLFWCHKSIADRVVHGFEQASLAWDEWPAEIQGHNVRKIAGSETWSLHSWALAWDIFARSGKTKDPKTGRLTMSPDWFKTAAENSGCVWGGEFKKPDPHHIEWPY
jgi:hypothetical protein